MALASLKLESVKDDVFAFLSFDAEVVAAEDRAERNAKLLLEAMGSYRVPAKDEKLVERKHAEVLNALVEHLQSQGIKVANERNSVFGKLAFRLKMGIAIVVAP